MSHSTLVKEMNFSLRNEDNYKKDLDTTHSQITSKISYLFIEYLKFILENINIKNKEFAKFVVLRGLNTIIHVFRYTLYYTKNLDLTYFHCQKSFYFYVEFVGQILEDDKSFLQLTSRDAVIYVYKKTVYEITPELKKKYQDCSPTSIEKLKLMDVYMNICNTYVHKMIEETNLSEHVKYVEYLTKTMDKLNELDLNLESISILEKIIEKMNYYVKEVNDFFAVSLSLLKKAKKSFYSIKKNYIAFIEELDNGKEDEYMSKIVFFTSL